MLINNLAAGDYMLAIGDSPLQISEARDGINLNNDFFGL